MDRPLSTLELTVLGVVLKRGPCVAHAVVSEFSGSNTFAYRSGAGSIYPLLKRMDEAGLVKTEGHNYSVTEKGIEAMRHWILASGIDQPFSTSLDDIRSRVYFLRLLGPEEIQSFLSNTLIGLQELLNRCKQSQVGYEELGDPFSKLAILGAVRETEARLAWIQEVQAILNRTSHDDRL